MWCSPISPLSQHNPLDRSNLGGCWWVWVAIPSIPPWGQGWFHGRGIVTNRMKEGTNKQGENWNRILNLNTWNQTAAFCAASVYVLVGQLAQPRSDATLAFSILSLNSLIIATERVWKIITEFLDSIPCSLFLSTRSERDNLLLPSLTSSSFVLPLLYSRLPVNLQQSYFPNSNKGLNATRE